MLSDPVVHETSPIGVFDSGLGGLSVLRELIGRLPGRRFVYVADSGYVPYGTKPPEVIRERSLTITRFLIHTHLVATVVVACNTATTHAVDALRKRFTDVPIVGMEPAVKPAAAATRTGVVGVLATEATLGGERFSTLVQRHSEGVELLTQPCPGLVEQVEAGDLQGRETMRLLETFTAPLLARGADTLVLGCTHYPFLRETLQRIVGPSVTVIDTGAAVARQTARVLGVENASHRALHDAPAADVRFYTSGDVAAAGRVVPLLLGREVTSIDRLPV